MELDSQITSPASLVCANDYLAASELELLRKTVSEKRQLLERCGNSESDEFLDEMIDLLRFVCSYENKSAYAAFEQTPEFASFQSFFHACLLRFAISLEEMSFRELVEQRSAPVREFGKLLIERAIPSYERMANTLRLANHSRCNKYVMVGIGRVPFSLFYLHDFTGIPEMIGIDNAPEAIERCQQVLELYNLSRIRVQCEDGRYYNYSDADIVYVACFARPKKEVLDQIARTAKRDCQIIVQVPEFTGSLLNDRISFDDQFVVTAQSAVPSSWMLHHVVASLC